MTDLKKLKIRAILRIVIAIPFLSTMFFLPAGTFDYWEAWLYMLVIFLPMGIMMIYLLRNDPGLLERRLKSKEKIDKQKVIITIANICFLIVFLLPGFDRRFGWSDLPPVIVIISDLFVLLGYYLFTLVLRVNSYASRIVEIDDDQKIITSGPYKYVRHPMYSAVLIMMLFSPLALGSYVAAIGTVLVAISIIPRILNEEKILESELTEYHDYMEKTKFRLIPGIW